MVELDSCLHCICTHVSIDCCFNESAYWSTTKQAQSFIIIIIIIFIQVHKRHTCNLTQYITYSIYINSSISETDNDMTVIEYYIGKKKKIIKK